MKRRYAIYGVKIGDASREPRFLGCVEAKNKNDAVLNAVMDVSYLFGSSYECESAFAVRQARS